ncbi:MAG: HD domain-containing protein [Sulfolobales archaeon]
MKLRRLIETAYALFPPFIGLVSWKYYIPSSALYHSLSVASIAGGIAELLTNDTDEVELAMYAGLTHDYYQKGVSVGLTARSGEEILKRVLEEHGVERKIVDAVVNEATRYNVAENPSIWAGKHPVAGLSMWLADTIAGASSAFIVEQSIRERSNRLSEEQRKLLQSLKISIFSVLLPQVALRSEIYSEVVESLRKTHAVPILCRDGLIAVSNSDPPRTQIDIDIFRLDPGDLELIYEKVRKNSRSLKKENFDERMRREPILRGSRHKTSLDESVQKLLLNVDLTSVSWSKGSYRCVFCGLTVAEPVHPSAVGYMIYASSSMERWNTRVPAVGINLNQLFSQKNWLKEGIVSCPLCVLDAYVVYRMMKENSIDEADYFAILYFPLPTHYEVAKMLSAVARRILFMDSQKGGKDVLTMVEESFTNPEKYVEHAMEQVKDIEATILVDSTWALHFEVVPEIEGELETMAKYLPGLARAILFTGLYPVKFSSKVDPLTERRLISPAYPLYDVDPVDGEHHVALLLGLLSIIDSLDDGAKRGEELTDRDRARIVMDYMRYPFSMYRDLMLKHRVGRAMLSAYLRFKENPVGLFA